MHLVVPSVHARADVTKLLDSWILESYGAPVPQAPVDTRTESQRRRQGEIPGALVVDRTVLEWRLDPSSPWHLPEVTDTGREVVVLCRQGYSSSLAAASLQALGLHRATDVIGGVEAWIAAGLPTRRGPADVRE